MKSGETRSQVKSGETKCGSDLSAVSQISDHEIRWPSCSKSGEIRGAPNPVVHSPAELCKEILMPFTPWHPAPIFSQHHQHLLLLFPFCLLLQWQMTNVWVKCYDGRHVPLQWRAWVYRGRGRQGMQLGATQDLENFRHSWFGVISRHLLIWRLHDLAVMQKCEYSNINIFHTLNIHNCNIFRL